MIKETDAQLPKGQIHSFERTDKKPEVRLCIPMTGRDKHCREHRREPVYPNDGPDQIVVRGVRAPTYKLVLVLSVNILVRFSYWKYYCRIIEEVPPASITPILCGVVRWRNARPCWIENYIHGAT